MMMIGHVCMLSVCVFLAGLHRLPAMMLGQALLVAGIIEGAVLVGWRLTQLPKSQALEFLLVSPVRPPMVLVAEALVGLARLAFVTIAGLPLLIFLMETGTILAEDIPWLLLQPFIWGAVTGLGLTAWAYEAARCGAGANGSSSPGLWRTSLSASWLVRICDNGYPFCPRRPRRTFCAAFAGFMRPIRSAS